MNTTVRPSRENRNPPNSRASFTSDVISPFATLIRTSPRSHVSRADQVAKRPSPSGLHPMGSIFGEVSSLSGSSVISDRRDPSPTRMAYHAFFVVASNTAPSRLKEITENCSFLSGSSGAAIVPAAGAGVDPAVPGAAAGEGEAGFSFTSDVRLRGLASSITMRRTHAGAM